MHYASFRKDGGYYRILKWNDDDMLTIGLLMMDAGISPDWLIRGLTDGDYRTFAGNSQRLRFKDNLVLIEPLFVDEPEQYIIAVDKEVLLNLAITWKDLISKKAEEITITRENEVITVTGKLP